MSGVELLGVVASTAQLVAYVITVSAKLNEVRCQIRHAPRKLEQYGRQLNELIAITRHIEQKPPIRTEELEGCLATISSRTSAIKEILDNFQQSSKNRRLWNIISGELSRQLDECFQDVRNTMESMVVLIVSQNAHGQNELRELMIGVATTTKHTTVTPTPLPCSKDDSGTKRDITRMKGSHLFKGITMKDNVNVSMGNISSSYGTMPPMAGHVFTNFAASGNRFLHVGNTGPNSEGHTFEDGTMEKNEAAALGDFSNLEQKFQHISLQRGIT